MIRTALGLALTTVLALAACENQGGPAEGNGAVSTEAGEAAGNETIANGLGEGSRFAAAAKAAGLDSTLAGPGPYTVLAPSDEAFGKLPAGQLDDWMKPESRAGLTRVLTYHIMPGTVLAEDIGKAIEAGDGKALLATMGGGTLTATREDGRIVLADSSGNRATVTEADRNYSNGVVHAIDTVLMPAADEEAAPPQG